MTFFQITDISCYGSQILTHANTGTIHSVYRKTINISVGDKLIALQAKGSPLSPISLITELSPEQMEALTISAWDLVLLSDDSLEIRTANGSFCFSYEAATIHNLELQDTLENAAVLALHKQIQTILSQISTGGFELIFNNKITESSPLMLQAAKNRIAKCTSIYMEGNYTETGKELARLIGLGIGLTPSGDDFLCGALAGLFLAGQGEHPLTLSLRSAIADHLTDTVDVSAAFLACALENNYSLAVNSLGAHPSADMIADSFLAIGHSSGIDTLCGIYYVLSLLEM